MGEASVKLKKRVRFLAENRTCYFCATNPATEIEHMPSRIIFSRGHTPEGYEFPVCSVCNRMKSHLEQVVAFYNITFDYDESNLDVERFHKLYRAVKNNNPELLPILDVTTREKRHYAERLGLKLGDGESFAEMPIATLPTGAAEALQHFARKLICALFYKVSGKPMPLSHTIRTFVVPPLNTLTDEFFDYMLKMLHFHAVGERRNVSIGKTFVWRWNYSEEGDVFGFISQFGAAFITGGFATAPSNQTEGSEWIIHANDVPNIKTETN